MLLPLETGLELILASLPLKLCREEEECSLLVVPFSELLCRRGDLDPPDLESVLLSCCRLSLLVWWWYCCCCLYWWGMVELATPLSSPLLPPPLLWPIV